MFYYISLIILWSIDSFIQKSILKKVNFDNYILVSLLYSILFTSIYLYYKKYSINNLQKMNTNSLLMLFGYSIIGIISYFLYLYIITEKPITESNLILNPMTLILTAIIGVYVTKEPFSKYQLIGTVGIIIGTIIFFIK